MSIVCVGDSFVPRHYFEQVFGDRFCGRPVSYLQADPGARRDLSGVREYEGDPTQIIGALPGAEVLVVHGAPVTADVISAADGLRLICCARGGPVNVDVAAATAAGVPVVTSPGKNAAAVADLTVAFIIALTRHMQTGAAFLREGGRLTSTFDGARFLGREIASLNVGLIGYGQVGRQVHARAQAMGAAVVAYDPLLLDAPTSPVQLLGLEELLAQADVVSLHARATSENRRLMNRSRFEATREGSLFVNTARESLVDEQALYEALVSGHLAGAALDVIEPMADGHVSPLLELDNVIITPHIGGATYETLRRGVEMVAAEVTEFFTGGRLRNLADRTVAFRGSP